MKPANPFVLRDRTGYRPADRCGQGPYRIESEGLGAKYAENLVVYACTTRQVQGNYRLTTRRTKGQPTTSESAFGRGRDNAACKARDGVVAHTGDAGGGGGAVTGGGKSSTGGGGTTAAAPSTVKAVALDKTTDIPESCVRTHVVDYTWIGWEEDPALEGRVVIDLWSDEPNDMEGLVFVVERHAVVPDMTLERWKAHRAAEERYYDAMRGYLDGEISAGRVTVVDTKVKTPPPPPPRAEVQPPRPSKNARWIPGYWHYEETKFHWIAGLWDVPPEDIQKQLTVEAPKPPPPEPVKVEPPPEPPPTKTAVWTEGNWQWDGRVYVWVPGAWRIPPDAKSTWQRPTWNVRRGRAVYVPGGWRVRVRLGR